MEQVFHQLVEAEEAEGELKIVPTLISICSRRPIADCELGGLFMPFYSNTLYFILPGAFGLRQ